MRGRRSSREKSGLPAPQPRMSGRPWMRWAGHGPRRPVQERGQIASQSPGPEEESLGDRGCTRPGPLGRVGGCLWELSGARASWRTGARLNPRAGTSISRMRGRVSRLRREDGDRALVWGRVSGSGRPTIGAEDSPRVGSPISKEQTRSRRVCSFRKRSCVVSCWGPRRAG